MIQVMSIREDTCAPIGDCLIGYGYFHLVETWFHQHVGSKQHRGTCVHNDASGDTPF